MNARTVLQQLGMCQYLVQRNVGDVTHAESLRTFPPSVNSLNWVLGHIVATRSVFLVGLGAEPVWTKAEREPYDRHAPPPGDVRGARPLAEIWKAYELSQQRLLGALEALGPERFADQLPAEVADGNTQTVGDLVAVIGMHDAYHSGQTGVYRRLLGRPAADI